MNLFLLSGLLEPFGSLSTGIWNRMHSYGEKLREERERTGLSQTEFGEAMGVTKKTQGLYERGEREPDGSYLQAAAAAGCDVLYILTGRREVKSGSASPAEEARRLALEIVQEWQIEHGKFLPVDKFLRAVELLAELAADEPAQVKKHAASVLRLAA